MLEEKQVEYWNEYKDRGQFEHQKQIKLMQQELVDMETSFKEMSGELLFSIDQRQTYGGGGVCAQDRESRFSEEIRVFQINYSKLSFSHGMMFER